MKNGLYSMKFGTPAGTGAGVVVISDGKLLGGDSGFAWVGTIADSGGNVTANATVKRHDSGMESLFGLDSFGVNLSGALNDNGGTLQGTSPQAPGINVSLALAWLAAA